MTLGFGPMLSKAGSNFTGIRPVTVNMQEMTACTPPMAGGLSFAPTIALRLETSKLMIRVKFLQQALTQKANGSPSIWYQRINCCH